MEFYKMLKKLRKEKGLTMEELSKKTGIGISSLSNYENGHRMAQIDVLQILASFFNVSLEYLTTGKEKESNVSESGSLRQVIKDTIKEISQESKSLLEELESLKDIAGNDVQLTEADKQTILSLFDIQLGILKKK